MTIDAILTMRWCYLLGTWDMNGGLAISIIMACRVIDIMGVGKHLYIVIIVLSYTLDSFIIQIQMSARHAVK